MNIFHFQAPGCTLTSKILGCVSVLLKRAPQWHSRGQRFDPAYLHQKHSISFEIECFSILFSLFCTGHFRLGHQMDNRSSQFFLSYCGKEEVMASIKEEGTRGKRLSYKIRVCLGRDENGRQISKAMRWNPPEDMTPAKARKEAQRVAAGCFINVAAIQIHHSKRCLHFLFHADDEMVKQYVLLNICHFLRPISSQIYIQNHCFLNYLHILYQILILYQRKSTE